MNDENNINSNTVSINNKDELIVYLNQYYELLKQIDECSKATNDELRKYKMEEIRQKLNIIESILRSGISYDGTELKNNARDLISSYFTKYDEPFNPLNIDELVLRVTYVHDVFNALLATVGKNITIDERYFEFDEQGKPKSIKKEYEDFMRCTFVHECLHRLSAFNDLKTPVYAFEDAFSEGLTDMFAQNITSYDRKEDYHYLFSVKVCSLLTRMIGIESMLKEYINGLDSYSRIKDLFKDCGLSEKEFLDFHVRLNNLLSLRCKRNDSNKETIEKEQDSIIEYIETHLIIPFTKKHEEKRDDISRSFSILFDKDNPFAVYQDIDKEPNKTM